MALRCAFEGWVRRKPFPGSGQAVKEARTANGVIARKHGNLGPKRIGFQLVALRIAADGKRRGAVLGGFHRLFRLAVGLGLNPSDQGIGKDIVALFGNMARDMMASFVAKNKGQLVSIPGLGDQGQSEADDRPVMGIKCLEGVRWLAGAVVDDDPEVASCAPPRACGTELRPRVRPWQ